MSCALKSLIRSVKMSCSICHKDLVESAGDVTVLPECKHAFHSTCIIPWFRSGQSRCPLCNNTGRNRRQPRSTRQRARALRVLASRRDAPPRLHFLTERVRRAERQLKLKRAEHRAFIHSHLRMRASEALEQDKGHWRGITRARERLDETVLDLANVDMVPLVVLDRIPYSESLPQPSPPSLLPPPTLGMPPVTADWGSSSTSSSSSSGAPGD